MKYLSIQKEMFNNINFKFEISPFGEDLCCCGYQNCIDIDCLIEKNP